MRPYQIVAGISIGVLAVFVSMSGCSKSAGADLPHFGQPLTTPEEFEAKVVRSGRPALVDFYATWCGPCRMLAPVLAELEGTYRGRVDFYRVDVDQAKALASQHRIEALPTLILYRDGEVASRLRGYQTKGKLTGELDALCQGQQHSDVAVDSTAEPAEPSAAAMADPD